MARKKTKRSRSYLTIIALLATISALTFAFWPRPVLVDIDTAKVGSLRITINEEGRTRVHDAYIVSTPVAGRLMRVDVEPGNAVTKGKTIVALMRPTNPAALDIRTREQARAAVTAAQAALRVARADLNKAIADVEFAKSEWERSKKLAKRGTVSQAALDRAENTARSKSAIRDTAEAAIAVREAELANARARLIGFDDPEIAAANTTDVEIPLRAPTTGRILRIIQKNETTLAVGTPIMEIGNIDQDLEIVVELISTDAVKISKGDRVIIDDWGGDHQLEGLVERVDPWGFKKFSSLGVEEQRVNAVIHFTSPKSKREKLGHGYRVETKIIIWQADNILLVPANALFREDDDWALFKVEEGIARKTIVKTGKSNGLTTQILSGLKEGEAIILYPSSGIKDGLKVAQRTTP